MKKKILLTILFLVTICFSINVYAATVAEEGSNSFDVLKSQYNNPMQSVNVNGTATVTLYGYSDCNASGCDYKYSKISSDFKEVLKQYVTCTNNEKYIIYQGSGTADGYKSSNSANYSGEAYWSEDFSVTCTNSSGSNTVELSNGSNNSGTTGGTPSSGTPSGGTPSGGTPSGGTPSGGTNSGDYSSSTTTNPSETGVETYYIVLGIVGIISYLFMTIIKKHNLFKNV